MNQKIERLKVAAGDPVAKTARQLLLDELPQPLTMLGGTLRTFGALLGPGRVDRMSPFGNGEDGLVAVGYIAETAAELVSAANDLLISDRLYAAASIGRQLLELEQLAWSFASAPNDAGDWLRSSREDRFSRWQPRHLRKRSNGKFEGAEYHQHCELGGHPTPIGIRSLIATPTESRTEVREVLRYEICRHGSNTWHHLVRGGRTFEEAAVPANITAQLDGAIEKWVATDRLVSIADPRK